MTDQTDGPGPGQEPAAPGCIVIMAVFVAISFAGALATLALYVLLVEQLGVIQVRREFGYDMIVYAPLAGLACGVAAMIWASRGGSPARRAQMLLVVGSVVGVALLLLFFGMGAVV
ncbi:MAG TPA: hypothetical protein VEW04_04605 [Allosphingosinicella sp.]|nr:hypothetical protein [Allosphingosinicella sp.]